MIIRAALIASLVFLSTSVASAVVTYTATATVTSGNPLNALVIGDVVTVDVTIRSDGEGTLGIGGAATGHDNTILTFNSGVANEELFFENCIPTYGCFNGQTNLAAGTGTGVLQENTNNPLGPEVQFVTIASLSAFVETGAQDPGVADGTLGAAQVQLVFEATAPGSVQLTLGALADFGDGVILPGGGVGVSINDTLDITVVPEPGTALLMGLGLAGLAAAGRRE